MFAFIELFIIFIRIFLPLGYLINMEVFLLEEDVNSMLIVEMLFCCLLILILEMSEKVMDPVCHKLKLRQ